jgi:hypothetical protein
MVSIVIGLAVASQAAPSGGWGRDLGRYQQGGAVVGLVSVDVISRGDCSVGAVVSGEADVG